MNEEWVTRWGEKGKLISSTKANCRIKGTVMNDTNIFEETMKGRCHRSPTAYEEGMIGLQLE